MAVSPFYDPRIDFFRGMSLIFIYINHIPDNAFTYLTTRTYALFDSAEVFTFIAGYSVALAYYSLVGRGFQAYAVKTLRRARTILLHHIALVIILLSAAFMLGKYAQMMTGYEAFIETIEQNPLKVALGLPLLAFQAPLLDILPMWVVVMLMAPFLIWLRTRGELPLLAVSGMMWMFASRFFPSIPTLTDSVPWNFNPFCWQLLFSLGLIFGWRTRTGMPPVASGDARVVLDICAAFFVLFSAVVLMTLASQTVDDLMANRLRVMYFSLNKQTLDLWRIVGLLSSAYLVARLISRDAAWLNLGLCRRVRAAGGASLPIFSLTVVLSFAGKFIALDLGKSIAADGFVTLAGVAIILGAPLVWHSELAQGSFRKVVGGFRSRSVVRS
ncbi:OpgC family protein [Rhodomicrobium sp.]|uniref:OpgC family protein n=1 Tax=Rhodomicrobium sp. TaxID=2720632 RepID=UPI0039E68484